MKIHLIFNAHLDPVWLWPWNAGLDELLATCRSACDRLDAHPTLRFTRGEAWVYRQIQRIDPALFARIKTHVASGRWEIIGGWWLQPDCNLPGGQGMKKQIELGKKYFEENFGVFPKIAYNVDSFGHAATLPALMRDFGQDSYVMMRPQEHEMKLPARLFRWRGYEGGAEVTTFRVASSYTARDLTREHIEASLTDLPAGVQDTMCFVGVGDHGGGPTENHIEWLEENWDAFPGCTLEYSSPSRFFASIAEKIESLPLVTGELQQHAIGCYSVYRPIKTATQRAEQLLQQAEVMEKIAGRVEDLPSLEDAWERVCFAHFHDTLGGTCLPSVYVPELDRVGYALAVAEESAHIALRRQMNALPDDAQQRIVHFNASRETFDDFLECEPWLEWRKWNDSWQLRDEENRLVPFQIVPHESLATESPRLLFRRTIKPASFSILKIARESENEAASTRAPKLRAEPAFLGDENISWTPPTLNLGGVQIETPQLQLIEDQSDTWSHGLDRFSESVCATPQWNETRAGECGALMASVVQTGGIGRSDLRAEWRVYAGAPFVELRLRIVWNEAHKLLKLTVPLPALSAVRVDGISGGVLQRFNDGREMPLRDWTQLGGEPKIGVVCPDVFALDATPQRARFTLLRAALMAHHRPHRADAARSVFSDAGAHEFRFRFFAHAEESVLESSARAFHQPPLAADLTRGMPVHISEDA